MVFKKKMEMMSTNDIEEIKHDLGNSNKSIKELSEKYGCFESVIKQIAYSIGIDLFEDYEKEKFVGVTTSPAVAKTTAKKATPSIVTHPRKRRVTLTNEQKEEMKRDFAHGKNRTWLMRKYKVSSSSVGRVLNDNSIKTVAEQRKEVKANPSDVTILPTEANELVPLSNYVAIKSIYIKLDSTIKIGGVNYTLFDRDVTSLKPSFDFESSIKDFFDKMVTGKGINQLKVYYKYSTNDMKISSILTKYCFMNNCNLSIITPGGMKEEAIIDSFCESNKNIQRLSASGLESAKLLYKTSYESIKESATIYAAHMIYQPSVKQIIVTDSFDKILEVFCRLCKQYENSQFKGIIYKITDGYQNTVMTTVTSGFIDTKN